MKKKEYVGIVHKTRYVKEKFFVYGNMYGDLPSEGDTLYVRDNRGHITQNEISELVVQGDTGGGVRVRLQLKNYTENLATGVLSYRDEAFAKICDFPQVNVSLKAWIYEMNNAENGHEDAAGHLREELMKAILITTVLKGKEDEEDKSPVIAFEKELYYACFTDADELEKWPGEKGDAVASFDLREFYESSHEHQMGIVINPGNLHGSAPLGNELLSFLMENDPHITVN